MNRAAESAVPQAAPLLRNAVKSMSVEDALRIVRGGDTAVTDFFAGKTREPLSVQFLPIVTRSTEKVALASKYNAVAGKISGFGLVKREDAKLEHYVTGKALDGLYTMIGEEETQDPARPGGHRQRAAQAGVRRLSFDAHAAPRPRRAGRLTRPASRGAPSRSCASRPGESSYIAIAIDADRPPGRRRRAASASRAGGLHQVADARSPAVISASTVPTKASVIATLSEP